VVLLTSVAGRKVEKKEERPGGEGTKAGDDAMKGHMVFFPTPQSPKSLGGVNPGEKEKTQWVRQVEGKNSSKR